MRAASDAFADHCFKTLGCSDGAVFMKGVEGLSLIANFTGGQSSAENLPMKVSQAGPAISVMRTGRPIFWPRSGSRRLSFIRYLRRLPRSSRKQSFAFLPLTTLSGKRLGVIALGFAADWTFASNERNEMLMLGRIYAEALDRARLYDEALRARLEAEKANQFKEEFLAVASHELKNPLVPILGWSVELSRKRLTPDKQDAAVDSIARNAKALSYLIDDLLDASRVHTGKLRLEYSTVRIQDVAHDAIDETGRAAEAKGIRVSTDISDTIPPFHADPRRVMQILVNLINNAVKFTPRGGTVTLKVSRQGNFVECSVCDSGRGIAPEFLPFVFDRFRQQNSPHRERSAGLGLGLAIVRELVELHGVSVKAHSPGLDRRSDFYDPASAPGSEKWEEGIREAPVTALYLRNPCLTGKSGTLNREWHYCKERLRHTCVKTTQTSLRRLRDLQRKTMALRLAASSVADNRTPPFASGRAAFFLGGAALRSSLRRLKLSPSNTEPKSMP